MLGSPSGGEGNLLDDDFQDGGPSVVDQVAKVEEILKKLNLVKRERGQVLKDLKEKVSIMTTSLVGSSAYEHRSTTMTSRKS
jgi:hypothetical protein